MLLLYYLLMNKSKGWDWEIFNNPCLPAGRNNQFSSINTEIEN
jgi:hypothetical protein